MRFDDDRVMDWLMPIALIGAMILLGGLILTVAIAGSWHSDHVSCLRLHEQTGYPTRMAGNAFNGDCYIQVHGRWIPDTRYRSVDVDGDR